MNSIFVVVWTYKPEDVRKHYPQKEIHLFYDPVIAWLFTIEEKKKNPKFLYSVYRAECIIEESTPSEG